MCIRDSCAAIASSFSGQRQTHSAADLGGHLLAAFKRMPYYGRRCFHRATWGVCRSALAHTEEGDTVSYTHLRAHETSAHL
eukprot:13452327-Alexandrium_andersonii.AAC.1